METSYVRFGEHCVVVRSPANVSLDFRSAFGAMQVEAFTGTLAGELELKTTPEGLRVLGAPAGEEPAPTPSSTWALRELCHATIKLLMVARPDLVWVHGGVVGHGGKAQVFSAAAGQGKSTLVGELLARGWMYGSDEVAAMDPQRAIVHPFPLAPRRRVHPGDFRMLDDIEAVRRLPKVDVAVSPQAIAAQGMPIERIWFLDFRPGTPNVDIAPCSAADAVLEMLRNSLSIEEERNREIAGLSQIAARVRACRLSYPDAEAAADRVHELTSRSGNR